MGARLMILCWHNIEPTWCFPGTSAEAGRKGFERQVRFLRRWANVVPLRPALEDLVAGRPLPPRAVALTFDDGYLDSYTVAAPLLTAAGLPATFFLVPGFLSGTAGAWWEDLGWAFAHATKAELCWAGERWDIVNPRARAVAQMSVGESLKGLDTGARAEAVKELSDRLAPVGGSRPRHFMDWQEAAALQRAGHQIGSHTCEHPILSREEVAVQAHQLAGSRQELESYFQRPIDVLAFPNGRRVDYSDTTLELVEQAGYAFALTTRTAVAARHLPPYEMPRVLLDAEDDGVTMMRRAGGVAKRALRSLPERARVMKRPGRDRGPA